MAKCRGCGRLITWVQTSSGKSMPCDPQPVYYEQKQGGKDRIVTPNGLTLACEITEEPNEKTTGWGYVPHWATCEKARNFGRHAGGKAAAARK